jgi:hypothetical protein
MSTVKAVTTPDNIPMETKSYFPEEYKIKDHQYVSSEDEESYP